MKNVLTSISAMLLVVWYLLSVIGFDVHTCSTSGEIYIATVASGFSCDEIHPDSHKTPTEHHGHSGCKCCHSHKRADSELTTKPCCSNDYQVILLTGVRSINDTDDSYGSHAPMSTGIPVDIVGSCSIEFHSGPVTFHKPRSGDIMPRDVQAVFNIWRI